MFVVAIVLSGITLMPVLAGMVGHPPIPYLVPLLGVPVLAELEGVLIGPVALGLGSVLGVAVVAIAALSRASRTH
jgi:hypothetical protein